LSNGLAAVGFGIRHPWIDKDHHPQASKLPETNSKNPLKIGRFNSKERWKWKMTKHGGTQLQLP